MNNNDIRNTRNGWIIGHNDQGNDKEGGNEVGRNNRSENTWIKWIEMRSSPVISFRVGGAGWEGFTWCTVTEGSKEVARSRDE